MNDGTSNVSKADLVNLITASLSVRRDELAAAFGASGSEVGVRYVAIDGLLPERLATVIGEAFPSGLDMRLMSSFREKKFTSKAYDRFNPILGDITFAFQDPTVIEIIESITGIADQVPDSLLYAGGLSAMARGHFLSPHIDNSHDSSRKYYRTLNLLYYVTPEWREESGGNLQLWNRRVSKSVTIHSRFNRLVLMETTPWSWHSVEQVRVDGERRCVSNYYFSKQSPTGQDYFNVTSFSAPPNQPIRRTWSGIDAAVRQLVRRLKPDGLGEMDVYEGPPR
jgi:Rps23 Pro-64 3,4-dihydroxylase Tpa1-like proline 4-hydroxylase